MARLNSRREGRATARPSARLRAAPLGRSGRHGLAAALDANPRLLAWVLLAPLLAVLAGVVGYPIVSTLALSFQDVSLIHPNRRPFVGLGNYLDFVNSPDFWATVARTAYFTGVSVGLELGLGLLVALLLNMRLRGWKVLRVLMLVPWAIPTVVNGTLWRWIYNADYGALNGLLYSLGLIDRYVAWLTSPAVAMQFVIAADVWHEVPFVALVLMAALAMLPESLVEAAMIDGASRWQMFRYVVFPMLRPAVLVVLVIRTVEAFRVFDIIYVITGGGPANATTVLSYLTYLETFSYLYVGRGAALSFLVSAFILALALVYVKLLYTEETSA